MRIGILSDTHMPRRAKTLPEQLLRDFRGVAMILHAGDLTALCVLKELEKIATTYAVRGNVDEPEALSALPAKRIVRVAEFRIGLVHGHFGDAKGTPERALEAFEGEEVDCIVFGHSHQPCNQVQSGILLFNPGSPTDRRHEPSCSYGILHIDEEIRGEIVLIRPSP